MGSLINQNFNRMMKLSALNKTDAALGRDQFQ